jgi:NAD(P)-dependent dehydrogenase (short-subunit alcohol dehydrogenase family)
MPRKLSGSVVVITGASSGIGRAAALRFAQKGATVVLAARNKQALRDVATECEQLGARVLQLPTDVTDEAAVKELARRARADFGRIDVWVNNAAVSLFARFEESPPDAWRRVVETNLFGYVHGARAVLPIFREQGEGVLINNASILARMGAPYLSAYTTTKFAIRGLSESLRQELLGTDIHVATVLPASIDTPIFQHAANFTGRAIKPLTPIYPVEKVARAIVRLAERPRRELLVGASGHRLAALRALAPKLGEALIARQVDRDHFQDAPAPSTTGNLFTPSTVADLSGGWRARERLRPGRVLLAGLLAVPAVLGLRWLSASPRRLQRAVRLLKLGASALQVPAVRQLALAAVSR